MPSKQPRFLFDPGAWMNDPALRSVSPSARALWVDMLCYMHPQGGYLRHATGQAIEVDQLARLTGFDLAQVGALLGEMGKTGVFSKTPEGVIYNRRMVRAAQKSELCRAAGKLGGNPTLKPTLKGQQNKPLKTFQKPTPEEVTAYALTLGYTLDGHRFIDHYEAKGWVVGKTRMKDWRAAVRTWRHKDQERRQDAPAPAAPLMDLSKL